LETKGFGTEKIEEEVRLILPEARVARMDLDTAKSKKAFEKIIGDFESHQLDILIGTQMVSKGLDFDNVNVVGILNADNMLNYPDFRAFERSFQLMAQVSGRAGRKNNKDWSSSKHPTPTIPSSSMSLPITSSTTTSSSSTKGRCSNILLFTGSSTYR
jgi:Primosomal protein N'' (replication factor Y) - superfamily II helicase